MDSEDEIWSNYNEDDLSDNDDKYNIKVYFTSDFCLLDYSIRQVENRKAP